MKKTLTLALVLAFLVTALCAPTTTELSGIQQTHTWDISVDGDTVSWKVSDASGHSWSSSYTDTDGIISSGWKYPCAFDAIGDAEARFSYANLWYSEIAPNFTEDFSTYTSANAVTSA